MKDYSLTWRDKVRFVLNYEVKDNKIIINYATGEKKEIPYSREEEDIILDKMKMQVVESDEITKEVTSNFKSLVIPFGMVGYGSSYIMLSNIINNLSNSQITSNMEGIIPFLAVCLSLSVFPTVNGIKYYKLLKDIDKNSLFQDNNFYMNVNMRIEDKYLEGLSEKTKEIIRNTKDGDNIFTFNTIDKMSYRDIKKVLENIERYNPKEEDYTPRFKKRTRR